MTQILSLTNLPAKVMIDSKKLRNLLTLNKAQRKKKTKKNTINPWNEIQNSRFDF